MPKVTVVGAGFVGRTTAMRIAAGGLADVHLVDIIEGWAEGLALDINHSAPVEGFQSRVTGGTDYERSAGSKVAVITAGVPRGPGMSRQDLLETNAAVVAEVSRKLAEHSPEVILILVTNPVDEMTFLASQASGLPRSKVMGMAGILDSARLAVNIADALDVSALLVEAMTLGSHGDQMVPLFSRATVDGKPLRELLDAPHLEDIRKLTVNGGAKIVSLLGKGSAFYAPSSAAARMVKEILNPTGETLPVTAWVTGQYKLSDTYVGVPTRLGPNGVEEIVELEIDENELQELKTAAEKIRANCAGL